MVRKSIGLRLFNFFAYIRKTIDIPYLIQHEFRLTEEQVEAQGTEFAGSAIVSEMKMAQITAVVRLAYAHHSGTKTFYIHEPSLLGLIAGANLLCAETSANPREVYESGKKGRGFSVKSCKDLLYNAGYILRPKPNYPGSWFKPLKGKE